MRFSIIFYKSWFNIRAGIVKRLTKYVNNVSDHTILLNDRNEKVTVEKFFHNGNQKLSRQICVKNVNNCPNC